MVHSLSFDELISYDSGVPGITLKVEIKLGTTSVEIEAKVDTGSTFCVFQRSVAEMLGIDIEAGEPKRVSTMTGSFNVFGHTATLITESFEFDSEIHFAVDEGFHKNILGRRGWLDKVVLGINDYDGKLYLSKH